MPTVLVHNAYGKSRVRLTKVQRHPDRHDLFEWSIDVRLTGDFAAAYTAGDNRQVVATDTMKNIVYALAADHTLTSPEAFAIILGRHFVDSYPQIESVTISIRVDPWQRIKVNGRPHRHAFTGGCSGQRTCSVETTRKRNVVTAGIADLMLLKTTDSAFRDFHRDQYRTLPDADDRIFATNLTAEWTYSGDLDWDGSYATVREALLATFAGHKSLGVQHTLHAMGEAALAAVPGIEEITLTMPNRHRLLVNLAPFGRENANSVFVATEEPHGVITGTLRRSD
ncbi:MAG TPA: urate oxidase [Gemmataceae bacterium]|jgi:urate oxidase|nr:urate oxidase [Gemmataceae bacterium]